MIYWAPLLHFYQPPTQTPGILMKIANESYRPLGEVLNDYPNARATVNINGVLTEMLYECGHSDVISRLRKLAEEGKIEFTGSGKHHPILPLIPQEEMERQIRRNQLTNRHFFGEAYSPRGFFPPEMCYSRDIVNPVIESRHEWIIMSGVACPVVWPMDIIHEITHEEDKLAVFFRDDILSNKISFRDIDGKAFIAHLRSMYSGKGDIYVVTAMDAETFGHHIRGWEKLFLAEAYETIENHDLPKRTEGSPLAEQHRQLFEFEKAREWEIKIVKISELLDKFRRGLSIEPKTSSWSTTAEDIKAGNSFPLWQDKDNSIHELLWEMLDIAIILCYKAVAVADNQTSRNFASISRVMLDRALHSDQFWWASHRPHWDINMVNRGMSLQREVLLNSYKSISTSGAGAAVKKEHFYKVVAARHLFNKITDKLYTD